MGISLGLRDLHRQIKIKIAKLAWYLQYLGIIHKTRSSSMPRPPHFNFLSLLDLPGEQHEGALQAFEQLGSKYLKPVFERLGR